MYDYTWDPETGGYILTSSLAIVSREPRPVYYRELDLLGFDKYWEYDKDDSAPYMWAEASSYFYRGRLVAKVKGGSLSQAPQLEIIDEPEPMGKKLQQVDTAKMVLKNSEVITALENSAIEKLYNTYRSYQNKIDVFYVAFSGGKDSIVVLDIAKRALPHNDFKVLFGDTQMEFPDTYAVVDIVEKQCKEARIEFVRATSHLSTSYTWRHFGPPATVARWCCSVHKTAPQIIALRKLLNKHNFVGMAFVGIRASESLSRSRYEYISKGEKHKGQYSCNPILEWNSAELYLYIYKHNLVINEAYKKGNRRAGCLVCPRASDKNEYMARLCYPKEFDIYTSYIRDTYRGRMDSEEELFDFINNGAWKARKNGRDLNLDVNYSESQKDDKIILHVLHPLTDWKIWINTVGVLLNDKNPYLVDYRKNIYEFSIVEAKEGYDVVFSSAYAKQAAVFVKLLKNVFRKSASCISCRECEADCPYGNLIMEGGVLSIRTSCLHCSLCHKVEKGCLVYKSLEIPKGNNKMKTSSLNCYSHHAPKREWFDQFVEYMETFRENHTLGSQMYSFFMRFLRDAGLLTSKGEIAPLAEIVAKLGLENESAWALMLANLVYTPQLNWVVMNMPIAEAVNRDYALEKLVQDGANEGWVKDVWASFIRLFALPFARVGLGDSHEGKEKGRTTTVAFTRRAWANPEARVILYSLYKYAEACGGYYQFSLKRLMDIQVESDGVSPVRIFGTGEQEMKAILNGLSVNYPEFISVSFTHDLDSICLNQEKAAGDVLGLFE